MEIKIVKDILGANDAQAVKNHSRLDGQGVLAINIMSSPGAGKTSLVLHTITGLKGKARIGVVEGDIASTVDADKVAKTGVPVIQINTGGGCHLDANMTEKALDSLPLDQIDILLVENVGNLICPAEFNLGEHKKVMLLSTPEGDDKPYKYPAMFSLVDVVLVNKVDLLPYLDFKLDAFQKVVKGLNPKVKILPISCKTGEGLGAWLDWLTGELRTVTRQG
jgi:hydrogenase nickel incorporation protein HypB